MSDNSGYCGETCKKQKIKCIPCVAPDSLDMEKQTQPQEEKHEDNCKCSSDNLCCETKPKPQRIMTSMPQKVDVKTCTVVPPPHPCDPPPPCDPLKEPDGDCIPPFLCKERLKNPESPDSATRCLQGSSIGVRTCIKPPPPHPCDTPVPCSTLSNKKGPCDVPPLCVERIRNTEQRKTRWVKCTNSKGEVVQHRLFKDD